MAVIRDPTHYDNTSAYIGTIALFCGISCIIVMLKFGGFKASLNFKLGTRKSTEYYEDVPAVSMTGAYRANREEFFGYGSFSEPPKEKITPSMVKLPPSSQPNPTVRPSKSTSNLTQPTNVPQPNESQNLMKSTPNVSSDPRGVLNNQTPIKKIDNKDTKKQEKEQKKLEKKRLEEQKKRDKLAAQEQAKQDKLKKEREKIEKQKVAKETKGKKDKKATPAPAPRANPLAQGSSFPTNTLDSSISRTSGPPPYTEAPKPQVVQNQNDNTGNTSFGKPVDNAGSSWDMVSQHRQQISRPVAAEGGRPKQMVMDLQYNPGRPSGSSNSKDNSEA